MNDNTINPNEWPYIDDTTGVDINPEFKPILEKYNLTRKEKLDFNLAVLNVVRQFIRAGYK